MEDYSTSAERTQRPVQAKYEPERLVFLLTRKRGKSISNGGFGIVLSKTWTTSDKAQTKNNEPDIHLESVESQCTNHPSGKSKEVTSSTNNPKCNGPRQDDLKSSVVTTTKEYLLIEEVLFLYERGILEAVDERGIVMSMDQLYSLLNDSGTMSLRTYLSYAHLRQQGFRVVRHSPERRRILLAMEHEENMRRRKRQKLAAGGTTLGNDDWKSFAVLKRDFREASAKAAPPSSMDCSNATPVLTWDVYPPEQTFSRSAPGLPQFSVLVSSYSQAFISFPQIAECIRLNHPIPIKIATVSDGGIVVLFGVTEEGIPRLPSATEKPNDDD